MDKLTVEQVVNVATKLKKFIISSPSFYDDELLDGTEDEDEFESVEESITIPTTCDGSPVSGNDPKGLIELECFKQHLTSSELINSYSFQGATDFNYESYNAGPMQWQFDLEDRILEVTFYVKAKPNKRPFQRSRYLFNLKDSFEAIFSHVFYNYFIEEILSEARSEAYKIIRKINRADYENRQKEIFQSYFQD